MRDSFMQPDDSFGSSPPGGDRHRLLKNNTYHGPMPRTRVSIDFNSLPPETAPLPLDQCNGYRSADSLASTTQSSDDIFGHGVTATPSLTSCASSPFRSSGDNIIYDSSLSTSLDSEGIECHHGYKHHQSSAASSPALLESAPATVQRSSHPRSLRRSRDSRRLRLGFRSETESTMAAQSNGMAGAPVRPTTLDISGHMAISPTGATTGYLGGGGGSGRKPRGYRVNQTPTQSSSGISDDSHLRSVTSPGSTPPHIDHPRTILNIDVDDNGSSSFERLRLRDESYSFSPTSRTVSHHSTISTHQCLSYVSSSSSSGTRKTPSSEERPTNLGAKSGRPDSGSLLNGTVSPVGSKT